MADPNADNAALAVDELKRKARRRLIGAVVLALAAATLLPLLLEQEQKPLGDDVSVQIPPVDQGKFVSRLNGDDKGKDAKPAPRTEPRAEGKIDVRPEAKGDIKAEPKADAKAEPKADGGAAPKAEPKSEPKAEAAPDASASTKPDAKAAAKTQAKTEPKADAKAEVKPVARPDPAPPAAAPKPTPANAPTAPSETLAGTPPMAAVSAAPTAPTAPAASEERPKAEGFIVQLGAFTDSYGANALANKLKKAGYPAYTEQTDTSRGTLWRVRVGGYPSRAAANEARDRLKADGQNGIVSAAK
jgi:DedD protein